MKLNDDPLPDQFLTFVAKLDQLGAINAHKSRQPGQSHN
jgi:hypothetical protein